jgi:hypothetical protein
MTSQTPFPQLSHPQTERPHSTARQAAEAFFSAKRAAPEVASGEVLIRRRESRLPLTQDRSVPAPEDKADEPRGPTVHRLPTGSVEAAEPMLPPEDATAGVTSEPAADQQSLLSPAPKVLRRKKRRQLHGEVTIIRSSEAPQVLQEAAAPITPTSPEPASPVAPRPASDSPAGPGHATSLLDNWPRYPKLIAQIKALEAAAEQAKHREAAEAVRWIKQAIRAHGLTPQDLGLR